MEQGPGPVAVVAPTPVQTLAPSPAAAGPGAAQAREVDWGQVGTGVVMMVGGVPIAAVGVIVIGTGFAEAAGCVTPAAPIAAFLSIETIMLGGLIAITGAGLFAGGGYLVGHGLGWVQ